MHSILVIGCGSIGERHLRCIKRTGRAEVTACDSNPDLRKRMADDYGVPTVADWEEALGGGKFDAVAICTPANLHVPMAVRALEKGLHVLVEKPLSQSLDGIDDLIAARDRSGRQVTVAYVYRVFPFLVQARDFLLSGEFGPVLHAVTQSGQNFPRLRPHYAKTYYRDRRTGGGAIQDALTHMVNWVESVIGPADTVFCDCAHQAVPEVTVEDTVNIAARHGSVLASYSLNQFQAPNETSIQFNAAEGSVRVELRRARWGTYRQGDEDWNWQPTIPAERDDHFIAQATYFMDQIEGRPAKLCSLEEGIQTLRFNLAAIASADAGMRVSCQKPVPV